MLKKIIFCIALLVGGTSLFSQHVDLENVKPGRFDQGKMWTFENPPVEYFKEAYNFDATEEWLDDARKSALRFASWCTASFVSENGLILTNHHCSRPVVASVMKEDENFDENGFYAATLSDERKVPDLFVDQLVKVADITSQVKEMTDMDPATALEQLQSKYSENPDWAGLELETRTFYSGGKYSIYGFKRYSDIRLVLYPELALGFFGGDPDNFTFPRYNLDFGMFRAYDENGNPLKPANYFTFNPDGVNEGVPVFVIGNPGSTGRYLTMAQLHYQRDVTIPAILSFFRDRIDILNKAVKGVDDIYKKDSIVNVMANLSNSEKAYRGRLEGMWDPVLMAKKEKREKQVREKVKLDGDDPWAKLEENTKEAGKYYPEVIFMAPTAIRGGFNTLLHQLIAYKGALESEDEAGIGNSKMEIESSLASFDLTLEKDFLVAQLNELKEHSNQGYMDQLLGGMSSEAKVNEIVDGSKLLQKSDKFFKWKAKKVNKEPFMELASALIPKFQEAGQKISEINGMNSGLVEEIANLQYELTGLSSPPDATFSLRIADGVVKKYEYNGTTAPYFTTYYGLYDRHYSHEQVFPWNLPERWMNPPAELLKSPLNFVCTADIIGGNSGSAVINTNQELVGLAFDGNMESLPGYFIFDDTLNRTVSVHAGGIVAALKYIYRANRILEELD